MIQPRCCRCDTRAKNVAPNVEIHAADLHHKPIAQRRIMDRVMSATRWPCGSLISIASRIRADRCRILQISCPLHVPKNHKVTHPQRFAVDFDDALPLIVLDEEVIADRGELFNHSIAGSRGFPCGQVQLNLAAQRGLIRRCLPLVFGGTSGLLRRSACRFAYQETGFTPNHHHGGSALQSRTAQYLKYLMTSASQLATQSVWQRQCRRLSCRRGS